MEKVAEHINEMQRIHEEYGAIFDHLFRQHQKSCKQVNKYQFLIRLARICYRTHLFIITLYMCTYLSLIISVKGHIIIGMFSI